MDALDNDNNTPLHHAVRLGKVAATELLLDKGADVNVPNGSQYTPLHTAA